MYSGIPVWHWNLRQSSLITISLAGFPSICAIQKYHSESAVCAVPWQSLPHSGFMSATTFTTKKKMLLNVVVHFITFEKRLVYLNFFYTEMGGDVWTLTWKHLSRDFLYKFLARISHRKVKNVRHFSRKLNIFLKCQLPYIFRKVPPQEDKVNNDVSR